MQRQLRKKRRRVYVDQEVFWAVGETCSPFLFNVCRGRGVLVGGRLRDGWLRLSFASESLLWGLSIGSESWARSILFASWSFGVFSLSSWSSWSAGAAGSWASWSSFAVSFAEEWWSSFFVAFGHLSHVFSVCAELFGCQYSAHLFLDAGVFGGHLLEEGLSHAPFFVE